MSAQGIEAEAEKAADTLKFACALAGIEVPGIGWSAVLGTSSFGLVHTGGMRPDAAMALAEIIRRGGEHGHAHPH